MIIMGVIYIGKNLTLLKINDLYFEQRKIKSSNSVWHHAPLIFDIEVQPLKRAEI